MFSPYFSLLIPQNNEILYCHGKYLNVQNFKRIDSVEVGQNGISRFDKQRANPS